MLIAQFKTKRFLLITISVLCVVFVLILAFMYWLNYSIGPTEQQMQKGAQLGTTYIQSIASGKLENIYPYMTDKSCESDAKIALEKDLNQFGNSEIKNLRTYPFYNLHATDDDEGYFYKFQYRHSPNDDWKDATASVQITFSKRSTGLDRTSFCGEASFWFAPWNKESPWYRKGW